MRGFLISPTLVIYLARSVLARGEGGLLTVFLLAASPGRSLSRRRHRRPGRTRIPPAETLFESLGPGLGPGCKRQLQLDLLAAS
eukprot:scaffold18799_cov38-Tisochrysis_lutea.AAC.1